MTGTPSFVVDDSLTWEEGAANVRAAYPFVVEGQDVEIKVSRQHMDILVASLLGSPQAALRKIGRVVRQRFAKP